MTIEITRRRALGAAAAAAGAALLPRSVWGAQNAPGAPATPAAGGAGVGGTAAKRALRLVHMTDLHIQPERHAGEGVAACLRHINAMADKPGLILTGGDLVMDAFEAGQARTKEQFELLLRTLRDQSGIPVEHCLGNHDIWGWNKRKSTTTGNEGLWGKRWALDALGLTAPYRSFDRAGWHFVVLDSVHVDPNDAEGYIAKLDEAQADWLASDLASVPATTPVLVLSHIPILTVTVLLGDADKKTNDRSVSGGVLHIDSPAIRELFAARGNVKLCLSGHLHRVDRVDFRGTTYLCNGAVSGRWWKGLNHETPEGYGVIDLFDDGSFRNEYVAYGWKADPE
jgi:3',5'-cyclic AMP phosphodiesterase CpdA